jgi:sugar phosphate isomerase/epimerase
MFDTHNTEDETEPHEMLLERYFPLIRHVHVNEMDGRHPGTGNYPFVKTFRTLKSLGYKGWVSLEAFNFESGGERIASETIAYLRRKEEEATAE